MQIVKDIANTPDCLHLPNKISRSILSNAFVKSKKIDIHNIQLAIYTHTIRARKIISTHHFHIGLLEQRHPKLVLIARIRT